jgi:hypothetical protein
LPITPNRPAVSAPEPSCGALAQMDWHTYSAIGVSSAGL